MHVDGIPLPPLLVELIQEGHWPGNDEEVRAQNLKRFIPKESVEYLIPDETEVFLYCPPFHTLENEIRSGPKDFWAEFGALQEIDPRLSVVLGDFGPGSDSPIVLNYEVTLAPPRILRLKISGYKVEEKWVWENHWVEIVPNLNLFIEYLGLRNVNFRK